MRKITLIVAMLASVLLVSTVTAAPDPAADQAVPVSAFESQDPQIQALRALKYEHIDIEKTPTETKYIALIALNEMIGFHGQKAKVRLKALNDFLAKEKLTGEYLANKPDIKFKVIDFTDGAKIAIAYVQSPVGHVDYAHRLDGVKPDVQERMAQSLLGTCKKQWPIVINNRHEVERIAVFLDKRMKFGDYLEWAEKDAADQKAAHEEKMAAIHAQVAANDAEKRKQIMAIQEERATRAHEERMKRMEYTYKLKSDAINAQRDVNVARYRRQEGGWNTWGGYNRDVYVRPRTTYRR